MNTPTSAHLDLDSNGAALRGVSETIAEFHGMWGGVLGEGCPPRALEGTGPLTTGQEFQLRGFIVAWFIQVWSATWFDCSPRHEAHASRLRVFSDRGALIRTYRDLADRVGLQGLLATRMSPDPIETVDDIATVAAWIASRYAVRYAARVRSFDGELNGAIAVMFHAVPPGLARVVDTVQRSAIELVLGLGAMAKSARGDAAANLGRWGDGAIWQ